MVSNDINVGGEEETDMVENSQNGIRKKKRLTAEQKYQILEEVKRNPGKKAEILRRAGLYTADVQRFEAVIRESGIKALSQMRPGRKKIREIPLEQYEALQREHDEKEKALAALTVEFLALKKKVDGE